MIRCSMNRIGIWKNDEKRGTVQLTNVYNGYKVGVKQVSFEPRK